MRSQWLFDNYPFISNDTVTLCKMQPTDADHVMELLNDAEVRRAGMSRETYTRYNIGEYFQTADAAFASRRGVRLGIYRNDSPNHLMGILEISALDPATNSCRISFAVRANFRRKGTATAAVGAAIEYLFERVGVNRIYSQTIEGNPAGESVLEHCGFIKEGTFREGIYLEARGIVSASVYSILRKEYVSLGSVNVLARKEELAIVRMTGADFEDMARWLSDEKVLKYYEGRDNPFDLQKVIEKFQPLTTGEDLTTACIIKEKGNSIGYIQFYPVLYETADYHTEKYGRPYGIDLFIGEEECRNRGLGPRIIRLMCSYLFSKCRADVVVSDPRENNLRSVAAFRKAGFTKVALLPEGELHEGILETCVIMHRTKE